MAYGFHTPVTIQSSKVLANHSNFPFPITGTYDGTGGEADLRTVANDGHIENTVANGGASGSLTVPADFVVAPNSDGSSPYDFEFEKYDPATGEIIVWVRIPTMDASSDKIIYMVYGDSTVTTNQEDIAGVWDANFEAVWHMGQGGTGIAYDSTANGNDLSDQASATGSTGVVGYGQEYDGSNDRHQISDASQTGLDLSGELTISAWVYPHANMDEGIVSKRTASNYSYQLRISSGNLNLLTTGGSTAGPSITTSTWTYASAARDATTVYFCKNGSFTTGSSNSISTNNKDVWIGNGYYDGSFHWEYDGYLDEVRISSTARSNNWEETTYNSFDTSTFLSFGSETTSIQSVIQSVMLGANF